MNTSTKPIVVNPILELALDAAVQRGVRDAMVRHARAGEDVAISRGGIVKVVPAIKILAEMDATEAAKKAS